MALGRAVGRVVVIDIDEQQARGGLVLHLLHPKHLNCAAKLSKQVGPPHINEALAKLIRDRNFEAADMTPLQFL